MSRKRAPELSALALLLKLFAGLLIVVACIAGTTLITKPFLPQMPESLSSREAINPNPVFEWPIGWSAGLILALGHGPGVVVGPGGDNPNIFGQFIAARPGERFIVTARAESVDTPASTAQIQINWTDASDKFISSSITKFQVTPAEQLLQQELTAPPLTKTATLYVAPGDQTDTVRYTEMSIMRPAPVHEFIDHWFFNAAVQVAFLSMAMALLAIIAKPQEQDGG